MTENMPTLEEWRQLYQAAMRIKELTPWEWMEETDVFGVQNPETGELGFVSVMGMAGEHYAISLYLGADALYRFWALEDSGPFMDPDQLLDTPQLQASFEDRDMLHKRDRDIIKQVGLKFRGRQAWPLFRSYGPGLFPWFLEAAEVRFLTHALEQTPDVALRFKEEPSLLEPSDEEYYLVRVPHKTGDELVWQDQVMRVPPPEPKSIQIAIDTQLLQDLGRLPRGQHTLEVDIFKFPEPVQGETGRPAYPHMLLMTESQSGAIIGHELLMPEPSLEAMWVSVPVTILHQLEGMGVLPKEILVRSELLLQLLQPFAEDLQFKLRQAPTLPTLDPAKASLFQFFG